MSDEKSAPGYGRQVNSRGAMLGPPLLLLDRYRAPDFVRARVTSRLFSAAGEKLDEIRRVARDRPPRCRTARTTRLKTVARLKMAPNGALGAAFVFPSRGGVAARRTSRLSPPPTANSTSAPSSLPILRGVSPRLAASHPNSSKKAGEGENVFFLPSQWPATYLDLRRTLGNKEPSVKEKRAYLQRNKENTKN